MASELAKGELKFVDPDVKVATQGLLAKAEFSNPGNRLRSGMRVRTLVGFGSSQQLAVPFDAVIRSAGQSFVYVIGPARELNDKQRQHFKQLKDDTSRCPEAGRHPRPLAEQLLSRALRA